MYISPAPSITLFTTTSSRVSNGASLRTQPSAAQTSLPFLTASSCSTNCTKIQQTIRWTRPAWRRAYSTSATSSRVLTSCRSSTARCLWASCKKSMLIRRTSSSTSLTCTLRSCSTSYLSATMSARTWSKCSLTTTQAIMVTMLGRSVRSCVVSPRSTHLPLAASSTRSMRKTTRTSTKKSSSWRYPALNPRTTSTALTAATTMTTARASSTKTMPPLVRSWT